MENALYTTTLIAAVLLSSCSGGGRSNNVWNDIDYSSVYSRAGQENDSGYIAPVGGCVDDDLLGCR